MSANAFPTRVRDPQRNIVSITGVGNPNTLTLSAGAGSDYADSATGLVYDFNGTTWVQRGSSSSVAWSSITGKPTTVAGYGITDALTTSYVPSWSSISGKPTTVSGYGITDALTTSYVPSWSSISGKPTTVAGYGITDALTTSYVPSWSSLSGKPTTVAGFGITDALTTSYVPSWSSISGKPTTVAGYAITDVYTQTTADGRFVHKSGDTMTGNLTAPDFVLA